MNIVVGITGHMHHGKDSAAHTLTRFCHFHSQPIATWLKDLCRVMFGLSHDQLYGETKDQPDARWNGLKPRDLLQRMGTELGRDLMYQIFPELKSDETIWCRLFRTWYQDQPKTGMRIVVPDVRFMDEVKMLKSLPDTQVVIVRVVRPDYAVSSDHRSEHGLDELVPDVEWMNDGSLLDLEDRVLEWAHTKGLVPARRKRAAPIDVTELEKLLDMYCAKKNCSDDEKTS